MPYKETSICPLSHLIHPHVLTKQRRSTKSSYFSCGERKSFVTGRIFTYSCTTCNGKLRHPYHPQHPLTFTFRNHENGIVSDGNINEDFWRTLLSDSSTSDPEKFRSFYRCSICNFSLDLSCFRNFPLQIFANPKSHHHSLVFYPRPLLTPCNVCGFLDALDPSYACLQCNYMVHQSCIDLPRVIKITRHQHRLSHTPYIAEAVTSPCRICYKTVDIKYGQYSCSHEACSYVVHSKCATHENVWDGKELEWEPEESDESSEYIIPFVKKYHGVRDGKKQCRACVLLINSHDFYNCVQCVFFLHEVCAGLLRKIDHALHVHPLVLDPSRSSPIEYYREMGCSVCSRNFSGSKYKCSETKCGLGEGFQIDVRCTLVPDYFTHESHEHPLLISTSLKGKNKICCNGCKKICMQSYPQCSVCEFALCFQCATEVVDGMNYWCEVCEKKVNPLMDWFYTCDECCTTIHLHCVFGPSVYLMPGFSFRCPSTIVTVFRNGNSTRPCCVRCGQQCPSSVYYSSQCSKIVSCSLKCLWQQNSLCSVAGRATLAWTSLSSSKATPL
ncbi:hypothetical protein Bca4012_066277 [Brassica carinata]